MTSQEIKKAKKLIEEHAERTETAIEGRGQCLTAYWYGGGQSRFSSLAAVESWVADRNRRNN